jgi:3-isopropylmalate dehydrogenase
MIVSGQMLLAWLGRKHQNRQTTEAAAMIARAVDRVMLEQPVLTPDLGGQGTTATMTDEIVRAILT